MMTDAEREAEKVDRMLGEKPHLVYDKTIRRKIIEEALQRAEQRGRIEGCKAMIEDVEEAYLKGLLRGAEIAKTWAKVPSCPEKICSCVLNVLQAIRKEAEK